MINIIFLIFLSAVGYPTMATESEVSSEVGPDENSSSKQVLLTPVILTLAINEADKNTPSVIQAKQESILNKLEPFQTENIRRYTSLPLLAISADPDALKFLKNSADIILISNDGVSYPLTPTEADHKSDTRSLEDSDRPCRK
jgi:hypothetical protein